ncbi:NUDIX hydrolase [Reyranella sp.]|uniref:NUDIX hydrolase n=1 Tax=Reyranella sp. TaxID=1929291 RepID=UPI0040361EEC
MTPPPAPSDAVAIELNAVLVALTANQPLVLTLEDGTLLPSGPFATEHPTLQSGVRAWVERQTNHPLGYVEQLYTFADRDRPASDGRRRVVSISYLGLTRERLSAGARDPEWRSWYRYFPWEDWRAGPSPLIAETILPKLATWVEAGGVAASRRERQQRVDVSFGDSAETWNEDMVLQRYELLYEAGLVPEARHSETDPVPGMPMRHDHRRILATGIARLRAKIKYRPVFFELMPPEFTLLQLQRAVEALAGRPMHKQNFRRLIDAQGLVEPTGASTAEARGRPAKLFRFRGEVVLERAVLGSKLPLSRPI